MSTILSRVREELWTEASTSPNLLADLANLERYVAESYSGRSFIELLQNADDAHARRFALLKVGASLICANDGKPFSEHDFRSLCRSASSGKRRGESIGYRGIGFKSIVGIANEVHLFSENLEATFSRELTSSALASQSAAPIVRLPHPLSLLPGEPVLLHARRLQKEGFTTVFVLGGINTDKVNDEFAMFEAEYLLFLKNVEAVELREQEVRTFTCERHQVGASCRTISVTAPERHAQWRLYAHSNCEIAVSCIDGKPVALASDAALVHAFLPTQEQTGLGVRVNADFSTDPSRTRVVLDEISLECIDAVAEGLAQLVRMAFLDPVMFDLRAVLVPTLDVSTLSLQRRSFRTELILRLRNRLRSFSTEMVLAPEWLNAADTAKLSTHLSIPVLPHSTDDAAPTTFLKYVGVRTVTLKDVAASPAVTDFSNQGCAELIAKVANDVTSGVELRDLANVPVWVGKEGRRSLAQISSQSGMLDQVFIAQLKEAGLSQADLARALASIGLSTTSVIANLETNADDGKERPKKPADLSAFLSQGTVGSAGNSCTFTSRSIPAWRGAEIYVAKLLEGQGFEVEDTSRQNIGYDLVAGQNSLQTFIEVKLLDWAGQPFILTSNEQAVAQEHGNSYVIALVIKGKDEVRLHFIRDPARTLKFQRQCRQWVWECSEYEFGSGHTVSI